MDKVSRSLYETLKRYFRKISLNGYEPYSNVYALLVYTVIEELLNSEYLSYVTDEDFKEICMALHKLGLRGCMFEACIPENNVSVLPVDVRISEDGVIRFSEIRKESLNDSFIRMS